MVFDFIYFDIFIFSFILGVIVTYLIMKKKIINDLIMVEIGNIKLHCKNKDEYKIALEVIKKHIKNHHHFTECKDFGTITIHDVKSYEDWGKIVKEINSKIKEMKHV